MSMKPETKARLELILDALVKSGYVGMSPCIEAIQEVYKDINATLQELSNAYARIDAVLEGQDLLKQQTIRIRNALGGVPEDMDTEDGAQNLRAAVDLLKDKVSDMEDTWYSPNYMYAVQERTIEPLQLALAGLISLLLDSSTPIGPMTGRSDYPLELIKAMEVSAATTSTEDLERSFDDKDLP